MIIVMFISLISVRLIFRELGVVDYGLYNAIGGVVTAMSFITSVMASASQRYFAIGIAKGNLEEQKRNCCSVIMAFIVILIIGLLLIESIGLWFVVEKMNILRDRYDACLWVFHLSAITLLIHLFATPFHSLIVAHEDMNLYAAVSIFDAILKIGCVLLLSFGTFDKLIMYALLMALESIVIFFIYFTVAIKKYPELKFKTSFEFARIKEILSFSSWTLVGALAGTATNQGTNIILNIFAGPIANAAFAIANQVGVAINTCGFGFFNAVRPPLMKSYASGNHTNTLKLFNMSNKLLFILLMYAIVPLYICTPEILELWIGENNTYTVSFTRIMILCVFVQCMGNPITTIIQAADKVKIYHLLVDGVILVSIAVSYLLMHFACNVHWILFVNLLFFIIGHFIRLYVLGKHTEINIQSYITRFLIPAIIIIIISIVCFKFLAQSLSNNSIINILLVTVFNFVYITFTSYMFLMTNDERSYIIRTIKKI